MVTVKLNNQKKAKVKPLSSCHMDFLLLYR